MYNRQLSALFYGLMITSILSLALNLSPQLGSMLGGTLVTLRGPCFEQQDIVECIFDGTSSPGVYVNRDSVVCVSPSMSAIGKVDVTLRITRGSEIITRRAFFYSGIYK